MKNRKVIVTLEVETNLTVKQLKSRFVVGQTDVVPEGYATLLQASYNVVKAPKATK